LNAKLGTDHPYTLNCMDHLATSYLAAGREADSLKVHEETLVLRRGKLGTECPETLINMEDVGLIYLKQKRLVEAERLLRECLVLRQEKMPDDWRFFHTQSLLGGSVAGQKRYEEAEPLLLKGYEGINARAQQMPALKRMHLIESIQRLVALYDAWGKPNHADAWRQKLEAAKKSGVEAGGE
jgi:hypothetical protein